MRINELIIYTSKLDSQVKFYETRLKLTCIEQTEKRATFQIGDSLLTFESRKDATPYHFAINIPSHKEREALEWLKDRVEILKEEDIEIHDFNFWNAMAMYFYDADKNIVELISRRNLNNETTLPFDSNQLLCISEIGLATVDIEEKFKQLNELSNIESFSGSFERFLAAGDDHGLFIIVDKRTKDWFPTGDEAYTSDFELDFSSKEKNCRIRFENDKLFDLSTAIT